MSKSIRSRRRGAVVVLFAAALVVVVILAAFAVDLGYLYTVRTELQCAADSGALAGAAELTGGASQAVSTAREYVQRNVDVPSEEVEVAYGRWDRQRRTFVPGELPRDALQVTVRQPNAPLFFGRITGRSSQSLEGRAIASFQPRDIMLVLDYSGSMNEHRRIDELKEAVSLLVSILESIDAPDRVGFARYSTWGKMIVPLTEDLALVEAETRKYNANGWTNIGEGMERARLEFERNARPNAGKIMVLMTDGKVNRPRNRDCRAYVLDEAELAAANRIAAITISFGDDADRTLMQEVADITRGVHFNVPDTVEAQEGDLREVFRKIAMNRAATLVD